MSLNFARRSLVASGVLTVATLTAVCHSSEGIEYVAEGSDCVPPDIDPGVVLQIPSRPSHARREFLADGTVLEGRRPAERNLEAERMQRLDAALQATGLFAQPSGCWLPAHGRGFMKTYESQRELGGFVVRHEGKLYSYRGHTSAMPAAVHRAIEIVEAVDSEVPPRRTESPIVSTIDRVPVGLQCSPPALTEAALFHTTYFEEGHCEPRCGRIRDVFADGRVRQVDTYDARPQPHTVWLRVPVSRLVRLEADLRSTGVYDLTDGCYEPFDIVDGSKTRRPESNRCWGTAETERGLALRDGGRIRWFDGRELPEPVTHAQALIRAFDRELDSRGNARRPVRADVIIEPTFYGDPRRPPTSSSVTSQH
jgi:hypothetical protein